MDSVCATLAPHPFDTLSEALNLRTAKVAVIGLGYVGLPLVRAFADAGFQTIGYDVDLEKIESLQKGHSYIGHIASDWIVECIEQDQFRPTGDLTDLVAATAIVICVPTPLTDTREPDLSFVESTVKAISSVLRRGQLVVLESTTYPGTTRDVVLPILERSGLRVGDDFYLAYSPEREDPGNAGHTAQQIPKVVGGIDSHSQQLALALYDGVVAETVSVSCCEVAEACKILENTYRSVNIAMVNELKTLFQRMRIDIWEVIDAAKTKPFGFQAFYPGPGLGGHCIPIDPFYLSWIARKHDTPTRFIELAGEINTSMPAYVVERVTEALNHIGKPIRRSRIGILGVAYKKDVDDPRESPAFKLMELLQERGAIISYNDPHIPLLPSMRNYKVPRLACEPLTAEYLSSQDCVLIAADHSVYDWEFVARYSALIVDTRNVMSQVESTNLHQVWKA